MRRSKASSLTPDSSISGIPAQRDQREAITKRALDIGHTLLAIGPMLAQIFFVGLTKVSRINPMMMKTRAVCKASAHLYSFSSRTNNTKRPFLFIRSGRSFCSQTH